MKIKMSCVGSGLAWLAFAVGAAAQEPLPVEGTVTLTSKRSLEYYVEGRQTIPARVHVSCQYGTRIVGRGENPVLVIEGSLSTVGTQQDRVVIQGLTIELAPSFETVRFADTTLTDSRVVTVEHKPGAGILHFEGSQIGGSSAVDVALTAGEFHALTSNFPASIHIRGVQKNTKDKPQDNRTKVLATQSYFYDLNASGLADLTIRHTRLNGTTTFEDCAEIMLEGVALEGSKCLVRHRLPGGLSKTRLSKCDFTLEELRFEAPGSKKSSIKIDKPWFQCCASDETIRAAVVRDGKDDPENGALVKLSKIRKRRNGFADEY